MEDEENGTNEVMSIGCTEMEKGIQRSMFLRHMDFPARLLINYKGILVLLSIHY